MNLYTQPTALSEGSTFEPHVASRNIKIYIYGQLVSFFGTFMQSAVTSLLIMSLVSKESASYWIGLNAALMMAFTMVLSPFAGVLLDIWNKKAALIGTSLIGIVYSVVLSGLTLAGLITVPIILLITGFSSIVNSLDAPGRTAIIKDATNKENVGVSNRQLMFMVSVGQMIGPALAGPIVIAFGYSFAYLLNGLSFLVLIGALMKMKLLHKEKHVHEKHMFHTVFKTIGVTLKYMMSDRALRLCTIIMSLTVGLGYSCNAILAVIARDVFNGDPKNLIVFSALGMSSGIGSILAGVSMKWLEKWFKRSHLVIGGNFMIGAGLWLLSRASDPMVGNILMAVINFGLMASVIVLRSFINHLARKELAGTVSGITTSCFYGALVVGPFLVGYYAEQLGCRPVIAAFGLVTVVLSLIIPCLPDTKHLDRDAA